MLNEDEIAKNTNEKSLIRGAQLAISDQNVFERDFYSDVELGYYTISAKVFSSSGIRDYFKCEVVVDTDFGEDSIIDYSCTCPASTRFDGMCKHAVALAFAFTDKPATFSGYNDSHALDDSRMLPARTTYELKQFIQDAQNKRKTSKSKRRQNAGKKTSKQISLSEFSEPIKLFVSFGESYLGGFSFAFKIGTDRTNYVVKDIDELVSLFEHADYHAYGKKLAFVHTLDVLDPVSERVMKTMIKIKHDVAASMETYGRRGVIYDDKLPLLGKKAMSLSEYHTALMLDAIGEDDGTFTYTYDTLSMDDNSYYYRPRVTRHEVPNQKIQTMETRPTIVIDMQPDFGAFIETGPSIKFLESDKNYYALIGEGVYAIDADFASARDFASFVGNAYENLYIEPDDMQAFCAEVLPILARAYNVICPPELFELIPANPEFGLYLDLVGETRAAESVTAELSVTYNGKTYTLLAPADGYKPQTESANVEEGEAVLASEQRTSAAPDASPASALTNQFAPQRDTQAESDAVELVSQYFDASMIIPLDYEDAVGSLLYEGLSRIREVMDVYTTPAFDRLITDKKPRMQLGLSIAGNLINLDVSSSDLDKDELAALLASYRRRKKYHRLKSGALLDMQAAQIKELDDMMFDLGIKPAQLASGTVELPTYQAFYLDAQYSAAHRDVSFDEYIARFAAFKDIDTPLPTGINATLREYQLEGYKWLRMLESVNFGGILADEMGLGKTLQMITLLASAKERGLLGGAHTADDEESAVPNKNGEGEESLTSSEALKPALIVCPASLVYNWLAEFARFAPSMHVVAIDGTKRQRMVIFADPAVEVFICSYDIVRIDSEDFHSKHFSYVVLDEAQYIKNHATKTTRAIKRIESDHRFALTGTPIENRLSEVWSIFDFLMPGFLGGYEVFRKRFEADILGGDESAAQRLHALVSPFIMRRLKSSVLRDLPEKMDSVVYVGMSDAQRKIYDASEQKLRMSLTTAKKQSGARTPVRSAERSKIEVLAELTRLRQIALDPSLVFENFKGHASKEDAIMELISQAADAGRKVLVFSQFTSYLDILAKRLAAEARDFYTITGATPKRERMALVEAFNSDDVGVFLVSLKAGGTGLNLVGASVVIHADPWWNSAAMDQATDRAHRIGQTRDVDVYKVISKGTIEERILDLQQKKSDLADAIISESSGIALGSLSTDDLLTLLGEG